MSMSSKKQVVLVSCTGTEAILSWQEACQSPMIYDMLQSDMCGDDGDADKYRIPLPEGCIEAGVLPFIYDFLRQNAQDPIKVVQRPLRSTNLQESGFPRWSVELAESIPSPSTMLDFVEACQYLKLTMGMALGLAFIASKALIVSAPVMKVLPIGKPVLTADQRRLVQVQNPYGWRVPTKPVVASGCEGDES